MIGNTEKIKNKLAKRYAKEKRFKLYGVSAIAISIAFLLSLLINISVTGFPAFQQTYINIDVDIDSKLLNLNSQYSEQELFRANYSKVIKQSLKDMFPEAKSRKQKKALRKLVSKGAIYQLREFVIANPNVIDTKQSLWFSARDDVDVFMKGGIDRSLPESDRRLKDFQLVWIDKLMSENRLEKRFNITFFTEGDSREPERAGIKGAMIGSLLTMIVTMFMSFPIGVAAAIYLEEFAPKNNKWVDLIEININNLAAVPSIVFGLLGLAVFIGLFGIPRSVPLIGGLVLTLMTLPTIIITSRAALKAVPPSIREAALGLGASRVQTTFHHVVPAAMPGILTGTIIGMAQALGETAPLLMIGMVAFIADVPQGITDPSTVLPVQIYLWSDSPERAFTERTSAAIMVLLGFLIVMNFLAVILRKKFEKKW